MLTVQIGQCGNQVGRALLEKLATESPDGRIEDSAFFREAAPATSRVRRPSRQEQRRARAVLIDMEPKVVQDCLQRPQDTWTYEASNTFTMQSGSGNNWAYGYSVHGAQHEDALMDLLRREAERCDLLKGFLVLQSVAGGTGSGVGSFVTEQIADAYSSSLLLNTVVWPYQSGEVIVQNYNAILTMASVADVADGILVLQNDVANEICKRLLNMPRPSFDAINSVLATHLASVFLPVHNKQDGNTNSTRSSTEGDVIQEMCERLCSHAGFKLLDIKTIPQMPHRSKEFSTHTWTGILKHLHQMQIANSPLEEGIDWQISLDGKSSRRSWRNTALGNLLILRGDDSDSCDVSAFRHPGMYAPWSLQPFECYVSKHRFNAYDKSATLVSNSKSLLPILTSTVDKAYHMFSHGAYTHQYSRHAVDDAFFQRAFLRMDQIVQNYQSL
ncbi:hypothetical protein Poli38472_007920 [Pythium oligandrum]|uniref:Tubulin delta chain n=1 Tax=Pythium oligandrum TaxID=41045 RepID=A0A8K1FP50_PYTOL|nr:hypothetical protein Poli38472_007920 [Pythium oligandrum]|eukprot:TMW65278.1 hypothetical protein Poli38472_007920 [Pythium oligandrum]